MGAQRRAPRPSGYQPDGQHLLRSSRLATELVEQAGISASDLVVEIGAGAGRLTAPLAERAGRLIAVERDPTFVDHLRTRFADDAHVRIDHANALQVVLPGTPYRVFGNLPFSFGSRILGRLLDDVAAPLHRLDALVQFEVARKRTQIAPNTLVSLGWQPWWEFRLVRKIPRRAFEPVPSVDAGMLVVTRRGDPLLPAEDRTRFVRTLSKGYASPDTPLRISLRRQLPDRVWARLCRDRAIDPNASATELDVFDWVAVFEVSTDRSGRHRDGHAAKRVDLVDVTDRIDEQAVRAALSLLAWSGGSSQLDRIAETYRDGPRLYAAQATNGDLVGVIGVELTAEDVGVILHLAVVPASRGQGIGRAMVEAAQRRLALVTLRAETDRDTVGFYRAIGFRVHSLGERYPGVERFACERVRPR